MGIVPFELGDEVAEFRKHKHSLVENELEHMTHNGLRACGTGVTDVGVSDIDKIGVAKLSAVQATFGDVGRRRQLVVRAVVAVVRRGAQPMHQRGV